jgi:hypothetical protein
LDGLSPIELADKQRWIRAFAKAGKSNGSLLERFRSMKIDSPSAVRAEILGRPILAPDSGASLDRVRNWLQECIKEHRSCRKTISGIGVDDGKEASPLPTRIIQVGTDEIAPRLITPDGCLAQYVTLSYCWGQCMELNTLMARRSNLEALKTAVPLLSLPRTIRDAIIVTGKLGIEFLWVDRLCIIQDNVNDWL